MRPLAYSCSVCAAALLALLSVPAAAQDASTAGISAPPTLHPAAPAGKAVTVLPIAIAADDNAALQAGQVAWLIEKSIRDSQGKFEYVDPQVKFDPVGVGSRKDKLQKGDEALAIGTKQFINLEEGLGIEFFERAISAYEEAALWEPGNFHKLAQAFVMRILVKWAEDPNGTRKEVERVLTMDPTAEFPKEYTPQDLALEVQRQRDAVPFVATRVSLDVSSEPVPARIYIDGIYKGVAPMSVRNLIPGDHYLSLLAPGYEAAQQIVKAAPGETITIKLKLTSKGAPWVAFNEAIKKGFATQVELDKARFMGAVNNAQQVVIARVARGQGRISIILHRINAKDLHVIQEVMVDNLFEQDPNLSDKLSKAINDLFATDRPYCENGTKPCAFKKSEPPPQPTDWGKVKLYVGIGSAAVFTTGVVLGIVARSEAKSYAKLTQVDTSLPSQRSQLQHTAVAADVLMALGLAGGATLAYLQFGLPYVQRTQIPDTPALEKEKGRDEEKKPEKKKRDEEPDPFALGELPVSHRPSVFAAPVLGGLSFGVQGAF